MPLDAATQKKLSEANLRKLWSNIKKDQLKALGKEFPEEAKAAAKVFDQGLGPEIDNFYKLLGSSKPDKAAIEKSYKKLSSIVYGYTNTIKGSDAFAGKVGMALGGLLEGMQTAIDTEYAFIKKHL